MDAGNAVTPICFPNFQNEVLAPADASAVDSSTVLTLLRFPLTGRETPGVSTLTWLYCLNGRRYFPLDVHSAQFRSCENVFSGLEDNPPPSDQIVGEVYEVKLKWGWKSQLQHTLASQTETANRHKHNDKKKKKKAACRCSFLTAAHLNPQWLMTRALSGCLPSDKWETLTTTFTFQQNQDQLWEGLLGASVKFTMFTILV